MPPSRSRLLHGTTARDPSLSRLRDASPATHVVPPVFFFLSPRPFSIVARCSSLVVCVTLSCFVLPTDPSPWSAVRGSPELRAYSSMPRGSVPWPQRTSVVAVRGGRPADARPTATTTTTTTVASDDQKVQRQQQQSATATDVTVHLVDTCGRVIDIRPMPETMAAVASLSLPSSGVDGPDCDRRKHASALAGCLTRVQEDLKHIPPGKRSRGDVFI